MSFFSYAFPGAHCPLIGVLPITGVAWRAPVKTVCFRAQLEESGLPAARSEKPGVRMQIDCIGSPLRSKASNNVRSVRCSVRCKENLCSTVQTKDLENPLSSNGTGTENRSRTTPSSHERLQVAAFGKPDFFQLS